MKHHHTSDSEENVLGNAHQQRFQPESAATLHCVLDMFNPWVYQFSSSSESTAEKLNGKKFHLLCMVSRT